MRVGAFFQYAGCIVAGATLAACGSFDISIPSKKIEYKSAGKLPSLEVPQDLTPPSSDTVFTVPQTKKPPAADIAVPGKGPAVAVTQAGKPTLPGQADVRVERDGAQRWLVVKGDATAVWQTLKDFWHETGLEVKLELPEAGVMETGWAENRASLPGGWLGFIYSSDTRDKFRCRIERAGNGSTEIHVSHYGMQEVFVTETKDQTRWQQRKPEPALELEMLRRMMVRFGVPEPRAKQLLAEASGETRASKASNSGGVLTLNEQFDLAWRRVGLALDRVGYTVIERDRAKGIYTVRYIDPRTDSTSAKDTSGTVGSILGRLNPFAGTTAKTGEQFLIAVRDKSAVSQVNVVSKDGREDNSAVAGRILALLYDELR